MIESHLTVDPRWSRLAPPDVALSVDGLAAESPHVLGRHPHRVRLT